MVHVIGVPRSSALQILSSDDLGLQHLRHFIRTGKRRRKKGEKVDTRDQKGASIAASHWSFYFHLLGQKPKRKSSGGKSWGPQLNHAESGARTPCTVEMEIADLLRTFLILVHVC